MQRRQPPRLVPRPRRLKHDVPTECDRRHLPLGPEAPKRRSVVGEAEDRAHERGVLVVRRERERVGARGEGAVQRDEVLERAGEDVEAVGGGLRGRVGLAEEEVGGRLRARREGQSGSAVRSTSHELTVRRKKASEEEVESKVTHERKSRRVPHLHEDPNQLRHRLEPVPQRVPPARVAPDELADRDARVAEERALPPLDDDARRRRRSRRARERALDGDGEAAQDRELVHGGWVGALRTSGGGDEPREGEEGTGERSKGGRTHLDDLDRAAHLLVPQLRAHAPSALQSPTSRTRERERVKRERRTCASSKLPESALNAHHLATSTSTARSRSSGRSLPHSLRQLTPADSTRCRMRHSSEGRNQV